MLRKGGASQAALNELAAALGDDAKFASTVTNALALKAEKSANLSDLASAAAARVRALAAVLSGAQPLAA